MCRTLLGILSDCHQTCWQQWGVFLPADVLTVTRSVGRLTELTPRPISPGRFSDSQVICPFWANISRKAGRRMNYAMYDVANNYKIVPLCAAFHVIFPDQCQSLARLSGWLNHSAYLSTVVLLPCQPSHDYWCKCLFWRNYKCIFLYFQVCIDDNTQNKQVSENNLILLRHYFLYCFTAYYIHVHLLEY